MMKKLLALLTAAALMMGAFGALAEQPPVQDPVLATVGGTEVLLSEVEAVLPALTNYMDEENDYRQAVDFVIQQRLLERKIGEMGLDQFSEEEEAAFATEAQGQWEDGLASYVSYYLSEDTEEARAKLKEQAQDFYAEQGFSVDTLVTNLRQRASLDRLTEQLMGGYEPTDEEINETFNQIGESYEQNYKDNIMAYEYNTIYNQQPSWYTPAGYRGIVHILLQPDPAMMDNYTRLASAYEEQQSQKDSDVTEPATEDAQEAPAEETIVPEPVTQEMVDKARQDILDSMKTEIDGIYASLQAGETFESLIGKLGQDPGMQAPDNLQNGYMVHRDSVVWDSAFTKAAFSDKMQQVGDVSDPVVGSNGIHILKYLRDVPSGLLMTDAIHDEIALYLTQNKENEVFDQAFKSWEETIAITYDTASIEQASKEAAERIAAQEAEEAETAAPALEAVPSEGGEAEATQAPAN